MRAALTAAQTQVEVEVPNPGDIVREDVTRRLWRVLGEGSAPHTVRVQSLIDSREQRNFLPAVLTTYEPMPRG